MIALTAKGAQQHLRKPARAAPSTAQMARTLQSKHLGGNRQRSAHVAVSMSPAVQWMRRDVPRAGDQQGQCGQLRSSK
jgi:hypothetical protein